MLTADSSPPIVLVGFDKMGFKSYWETFNQWRIRMNDKFIEFTTVAIKYTKPIFPTKYLSTLYDLKQRFSSIHQCLHFGGTNSLPVLVNEFCVFRAYAHWSQMFRSVFCLNKQHTSIWWLVPTKSKKADLDKCTDTKRRLVSLYRHITRDQVHRKPLGKSSATTMSALSPAWITHFNKNWPK